jgi:hypothetical protein
MTKTLEEQLKIVKARFNQLQTFWTGYIGDTDAWADTEMSVVAEEDELISKMKELQIRIDIRDSKGHKYDKWV